MLHITRHYFGLWESAIHIFNQAQPNKFCVWFRAQRRQQHQQNEAKYYEELLKYQVNGALRDMKH